MTLETLARRIAEARGREALDDRADLAEQYEDTFGLDPYATATDRQAHVQELSDLIRAELDTAWAARDDLLVIRFVLIAALGVAWTPPDAVPTGRDDTLSAALAVTKQAIDRQVVIHNLRLRHNRWWLDLGAALETFHSDPPYAIKVITDVREALRQAGRTTLTREAPAREGDPHG